MNWHRFLISIPFTIFMWLWFMWLGYLRAESITKRNVIIVTIGALFWMLVTNLP
jgi:hypothetical protein